MNWSYDETIPAARDAVRLLIGDTEADDQQLSDESLDYLLAGGEPLAAAIRAALVLAAKYSRFASKSIGGLAVRYRERADNYRQLATELRSGAGLDLAVRPYCGGISIADKQANDQNPDVERLPLGMGRDEQDYRSPPLGTIVSSW